MGLFRFNEDVLTEIYFDQYGTSILQTIKEENKELLIAKNAIAFMLRYFSIVKNKKETEVLREYLINCFETDFNDTKTKTHSQETNHKTILSSIINGLAESEYQAAINLFGKNTLVNLALCTERKLQDKLYLEAGYSTDVKPDIGKYIIKFKIKNNTPFVKLNIYTGKDKILLPLSVSIIANYAFLDTNKFKENYRSACFDFLNGNYIQNPSITKNIEFLSKLFEKHF